MFEARKNGTRRGPLRILCCNLYVRNRVKLIFGLIGLVGLLYSLGGIISNFVGCVTSFSWGELFASFVAAMATGLFGAVFCFCVRRLVRNYFIIKHGAVIRAKIVTVTTDYKVMYDGGPTYKAMLVTPHGSGEFGCFSSESLKYNPVERFIGYDDIPVYYDPRVPDFEAYFVDLEANIRPRENRFRF